MSKYVYLILVTDLIFGVKKNLKHFYCCLISERNFCHVLPVILYLARALAGHYSKCLNKVYISYCNVIDVPGGQGLGVWLKIKKITCPPKTDETV